MMLVVLRGSVRVLGLAVAAVLLSMQAGLAQGLSQQELQGQSSLSLQGQQPTRQSVLERPRPDYDPLGIRWRSFLLYPSLSETGIYDDNIFALPNSSKIGGFSFLTTPSIDIRSDWGEHALNFHGDLGILRHIDHTTEDVINGNVGVSGRYDIDYGTYFTGLLSYQKQHEDRGSPDPNNGVQPTPYTVTSGAIGFYRGLGRLNLTLNGSIDRYEYTDVGLASGGFIDNELRNRTEFGQTVRLGYVIIPEYEAFVRGVHLLRDYDSNHDFFGQNRTSDGYEVDAGTALKLGAVTSGEVYAGWTQRFYDDPTLHNPSGPAMGASILWNVTPLTSLRFQASRTIEETTLQGASSYFSTFGQASIEHELLRNVLLYAHANVTDFAYQSIGRTDDVYEGLAGAKYLLSRNFDVSLEYTYRQRESNISGVAYQRNIIMLKLTSKL